MPAGPSDFIASKPAPNLADGNGAGRVVDAVFAPQRRIGEGVFVAALGGLGCPVILNHPNL